MPVIAAIAPAAMAASGEIGRHYLVALPDPSNGAAHFDHVADELVADDCTRFDAGEVAPDHMQIGTANTYERYLYDGVGHFDDRR